MLSYRTLVSCLFDDCDYHSDVFHFFFYGDVLNYRILVMSAGCDYYGDGFHLFFFASMLNFLILVMFAHCDYSTIKKNNQ